MKHYTLNFFWNNGMVCPYYAQVFYPAKSDLSYSLRKETCRSTFKLKNLDHLNDSLKLPLGHKYQSSCFYIEIEGTQLC